MQRRRSRPLISLRLVDGTLSARHVRVIGRAVSRHSRPTRTTGARRPRSVRCLVWTRRSCRPWRPVYQVPAASSYACFEVAMLAQNIAQRFGRRQWGLNGPRRPVRVNNYDRRRRWRRNLCFPFACVPALVEVALWVVCILPMVANARKQRARKKRNYNRPLNSYHGGQFTIESNSVQPRMIKTHCQTWNPRGAFQVVLLR